jgi:hypothetical protein
VRRMFRTLASLSLLTAMAAIGAACFSLDEERCYECKEGDGPGPGSGGGGGEIPTDPSCVPSAAQTPVGDDCGVFVSAKGNNTASGTKAEPVKTIAKAIELAGKGTGRVYACAEDLAGAVTLPGGVELYGGLDCGAGWAYVGESKPTRITAPAGQIALTLTKGSGTTRIEDVHVTAANASAAGGSSIAALVDGATVELTRCTLEAGTGADGASADAFTEPAAAGVDGKPGAEACSTSFVPGGEGVTNVCGDVESVGGLGGVGTASGSGGDGSDGEPLGVANGGAGEKVGVPCAAGTPGDPGLDGTPGAGGTGLGTLNQTGYVGASGADGVAGTPGQGGGGGGGSKGGSGAGKCADPTLAGGASGGSGASGGCGGLGGKGGGPGGASITLVSLNAKVTFKESTLLAKDGGDGGVGGTGQDGGPGGATGGLGGIAPAAAAQLKAGCAGGAGGAGGKGGLGGIGAGGHSLGIAFTGAAPSTMGAMIQKGTGGTGGTPLDPAGQAGSPGVSADAQEFAAP